MKRVIFFVLLIICSISSFPQNLVLNPGFEAWEKTNKPAGWLTTQNCLKDSVYIKSGNYSCRHEGGTTTKYLGQTITVTPGTQYQFSFYYKTTITGTGNGCRIWCYWKDAAGNLTDPLTDSKLRPSAYLKSDVWMHFSVEIAAPANAIQFYLEVRTYPNSIAYWDDMVFIEDVPTLVPEETQEDIKIYPNPVRNCITICNLHKLQHIYIQDLTGKTVLSYAFSGEKEVTIPVSGLRSGLYLIYIQTSEKIIIRKFIKEGEYNFLR